MTLQLLSLFDIAALKNSDISNSGKFNIYRNSITNFLYGIQCTMLVTIIWIIYKSYQYYESLTRPKALFVPANYFSKILMPDYPNLLLFSSIAFFSVLLLYLRLTKYDNLISRLLLLFSLMWINIFQWSFGFESHVGHFLLYIYLFSLFIPFKLKINTLSFSETQVFFKLINWFYFGLLLHYSISAFWKWIGLGYKVIINNGDIHWLSADAALVTAVLGYRGTDLNFNFLLPFLKLSFIWQIGFLGVLVIQTFAAIIAARIIPMRFWIGFALIIFHIINSFAFDIEFVFTPLAIFSLFFPYNLFLKKSIKYNTEFYYDGVEKTPIFQKKYIDGEIDTYKKLEALREKYLERRPLLGAFLYLPGALKLFKLKRLVNS